MPVKKKKQNVFSKINFKSAKTRGIIVLAAFAVVGGGIMVFRSFADTSVKSWLASDSAHVFYNGAGATRKSDAAKNGAEVIVLPNNGEAEVQAGPDAAAGVSIPKGTLLKACVYAKVVGSGTVTVNGGGGYPNAKNTVLSDSGYQTICNTPGAVQTDNQFFVPWVTFKAQAKTTSYLWISNFSIQIASPASVAAPAPASF